MDIKILDSWLREYLDTKSTPQKIMECLSLCGPSVERINKFGKDKVFDIEVTTNRVDTASVYGIAREAAAILPRFKIKANLKSLALDSAGFKFSKKVDYLDANVDSKLCSRFTAVLIKNVHIGVSPEKIINRLESAGVRSINNIVDISNYIMLELGQPVHTFDYDKIKGHKMVLRESKKGENITTLDGKDFKLPGGDIIIEDGEGRLIDLAGVMGGSISAVDDKTKNVLVFVQTYDAARIRKTSMKLAQRTLAATIFEKGTDTELVTPAVLKAINMFKLLTKGLAEKEILNIYPDPYKPIKIKLNLDFIKKRIGILLSKKDITGYLTPLEFKCVWLGNNLEVTVPSFRAQDVLEAEDVVEEIARIYGYYNFPSEIMTGQLTGRSTSPQFAFENMVKNYLTGWGGCEVYTISLVPKSFVNESALKLSNPLGIDSEYLRTGMMPSLLAAASQNFGTFESFHLFEMANIYLPKKNDLPEEKLILSGIFEGYDYRKAKGILEALINKLNIKISFEPQEKMGFAAGKCVAIRTGKQIIGFLGITENNKNIYYELEVESLYKLAQKNTKYVPIPKYPPQIEDVTFTFPAKTYIGAVLTEILNISPLVKAELTTVFKDAYTFRINYQDPNKTLTDKDVEVLREKIIKKVKENFGGIIK